MQKRHVISPNAILTTTATKGHCRFGRVDCRCQRSLKVVVKEQTVAGFDSAKHYSASPTSVCLQFIRRRSQQVTRKGTVNNGLHIALNEVAVAQS
jgi:hypothetical protein